MWAEVVTGTITFGSADGSTNINAASVNDDDSQGNSWTITTVGTTSFTPNASYAQVGASKSPATSITFTTTLPSSVNITAMSAKFGGFSGTAGTITLKVGETSIGTGSLNATNDVTVNSSTTATGTVLTVTVTGISKGVKCYYISYTYSTGGTPTCATPTFLPVAGTYTTTQSVTIASETDGASIYYTTDGSTPTDESTLYSSAISVSSTTTVKAIAIKDGMTNSSVASSTYTILPVLHAGTAVDPYTVTDARNAIDANTGTNDVYVTGIVCEGGSSLAGGSMNYWISYDGTETDKFEIYKGKGLSGADFTSTDDVNVGDIVVVFGDITKYNSTYEFSAGSQLISHIKKVAAPTFSPAAGAVAAGTTVTISTTTDGATIYYTTDGSTPTTSSSVYSSAISIDADMTIKAIAAKTNWDDSDVASADYTVLTPISGFTIDFEANDVTRYVDWEFSNIGTHTTTIAAHGGSYYGSNVNDKNNGTSTAAIKTKNKISYPGTFKCYISKESNNTTNSSWKVQVSDDGSNWTDAKSVDATSMSKGEWIEVNTDLTSYSGVYVRLYYTGSTAIRAVDDITLTEVAPVTITSAEYATYCNATKALDFSETGITVYKAKVEGSAAKLTKVSDGIVPANTGVILYHATADTYAVPVTTTGASLSDNELVGTTAETAVDYSAGGKFNYILQMDGANPVFRKATGNKIRANRAYLSTTYDVTIAGAPALDIIIEGENSDDVTTGIDTIEHSTLNIEHSEVYNLNGQRVAQPTKGLYIVNGRKVVIK